MSVLQDELNLIIDDFGANPARREAVQDYHELLVDYMNTCNVSSVIHVKGRYMPFKS